MELLSKYSSEEAGVSEEAGTGSPKEEKSGAAPPKTGNRQLIDGIELVFALVENLLAFRIAFKFLGVENPNIYFQLVYKMTDPLVKPLLAALPRLTVQSNASILEGGSILLVLLLLGIQRVVVYRLNVNS